MTVYRIPEKLSALIFDIDGTLYTSAEYVAEQVDAQVRHYAHLHGMEEDEARSMISRWRSDWAGQHGGKKISLGNTLTHFGVSIETSIEWRNTLLFPERYLKKDEALKEALVSLSGRFALVCLTNNPVEAAEKTLRAIGIDGIIPDIVGLDTCMKSKPDEAMLAEAVRRTGVPKEECMAIGDRYDIDLALPLSLGMGAVLVSGAEDVKRLGSVI